MAHRKADPGEPHRRATGRMPPDPPRDPFEAAARVIAIARRVASTTECAYCQLPSKQCELHSDDCMLGELRRAFAQYDTMRKR